MNKGIKITISEPCSQKWEELTVVEQGRFCASCQKVVIDFTKMTDSELLDYFNNYQGNTCGSFSPFQTNRVIGGASFNTVKKPIAVAKYLEKYVFLTVLKEAPPITLLV